jgi:hypothetical protein
MENLSPGVEMWGPGSLYQFYAVVMWDHYPLSCKKTGLRKKLKSKKSAWYDLVCLTSRTLYQMRG